MDTEVLIVGAGPVGLTLSIDLGKRGVRCILIEKNEAPLGYPKMERCNPRTMEIFRRLGLADTVRAAGYPPDWPMDIYFVFDLMRPPLFKMAHPTGSASQGPAGCHYRRIIAARTLSNHLPVHS
jgi:2-polyprenyl-6-methoxyphenol hydroxylase-like FAD-dependent oxidoreductase